MNAADAPRLKGVHHVKLCHMTRGFEQVGLVEYVGPLRRRGSFVVAKDFGVPVIGISKSHLRRKGESIHFQLPCVEGVLFFQERPIEFFFCCGLVGWVVVRCEEG